ncbi:MAG: 1-deoxy-D-xylulose-5-phosphate synthase [Candidatus Margulisiibacteriota bacterium]
MTQSLLDTLQFPQDLKRLSLNELEQLAGEIRERLVDIGNVCGGHLASNLGVVELTLALHVLLDSPKDRLLWDTSHQTYVHKMLTGRLDRMYTIRQDGGLSGFAKIDESEHDTFGAGHASTALSAGLGVAKARDVLKQDYTVVSIIGDASLSGGMSYEALNNIKDFQNSNFICILNDNDMSISPPVGSMSDYITRVRTSDIYNRAKNKFQRILNRIPRIGVPLNKKIEKIVERFRDLIIDVKVGVLFEEFGFKYIGPIDGHDLPMLMAAINFAKDYPGPIMVHIITTKGKGLQEAEADPVTYHGVAPKKKNLETLPLEKTPAPKAKTYTQIFGEEMVRLAGVHSDMVVITPAMQGGSGLNGYAAAYPERFFDVGIAEEHAVTFAAGLARAGVKPVLAIYSTFLQRGYDQMVHDVCLQKLPVIFALDRAGLVGEDGPTHHGVFDYNYMLPIPHLTILAPKDGEELKAMLDWAVTQPEAVSVRYGKGEPPAQNGSIQTPMHTQKAEVLHGSETGPLDVLIIGVGSMAWPACEAAQTLETDNGLKTAAINLRFVKPLDTETLSAWIGRSSTVIVVEEGMEIGGVFTHILQSIPTDKPLSHFHSIAIPDEFVDHGKLGTLRNAYNLTSQGIVQTALTKLSLTSKR